MNSRRLDRTRELCETRFTHSGSLMSSQLIFAMRLQGRKIKDLKLFFAGYYDSMRRGHIGSGCHTLLGLIRIRQWHAGPIEDCNRNYRCSMFQLYLLAERAINVLLYSPYAGRYRQRENVYCPVISTSPKRRCRVLYCIE